MIVRELLTLLGFTVDKASYDKAKRAYDSLQGQMAQQTKAGQNVNAELQKQGKAAQDAAKGTGMLGQALGMMQRFAAQAGLSNLLRQYTTLASDANETRSALDQLFGKAGGEQVQTWSETMGAAMGRSEFDLQSYAARLGSVLGPMAKSKEEAQAMAQRFSELAVDLGSFFNTTDQDAMQALRSGLTGEYESLKRFGVVLNDTTLKEVANARGIKKKITAMTQVEKTELRYQAILDRTTAAQGDAIRTSDGYANASKALEAQLKSMGIRAARKVVPVLEKLVHWARDAVTWFGKVSQKSHVLEVAMYTLATVAGVLAAEFYGAFVLPALAIGALILLVDDLWTTLDGGQSVMRDVIDGMFGEGTTKQVVDWIKATFGPLTEAMSGLDAQGMWQTFADGADNAGFAVQRLIEKLIELAGWLDPIEAATRLLRGAGVLGQGDATERAMGRGMDAPIAESISEELMLRQRDQQAAIAAGVAARNARRAEKAREEKFGPRQFSMVPTGEQLNMPMIPFAAAPSISAPAAAGGATAGAAPTAPTVTTTNNFNINGGDLAAVKRVVGEALDADRKKTMAAVGRRGTR